MTNLNEIHERQKSYRDKQLREMRLQLPVGEFCPICGRVGHTSFEKNGMILRGCIGSALESHAGSEVLLSWPYQSTTDYESIYDTGDHYHDGMQRERGERTYMERDQEHGNCAFERCQMLRCYRRSGRLLDVGCGMGSFVAMAAAWGFDAFGTEPNDCIAQHGRTLGRRIQTEYWTGRINAPGTFSVITAHDVIEHLTDPNGFMATMREVLTDDGLLVIDTPEWDGSMDNRHIKPKEHICLYSEGALRNILERAGFKVVGMHRPLNGSIGKLAMYCVKSSVN